jgi:hypothetical protein
MTGPDAHSGYQLGTDLRRRRHAVCAVDVELCPTMHTMHAVEAFATVNNSFILLSTMYSMHITLDYPLLPLSLIL